VVLTLASRSPALSHLVPDIDALQSLAISNVKPWAYSGSSLEMVVSVMEEMQKKQRLLLACI
jgi:fatty acid-binding protein DegV